MPCSYISVVQALPIPNAKQCWPRTRYFGLQASIFYAVSDQMLRLKLRMLLRLLPFLRTRRRLRCWPGLLRSCCRGRFSGGPSLLFRPCRPNLLLRPRLGSGTSCRSLRRLRSWPCCRTLRWASICASRRTLHWCSCWLRRSRVVSWTLRRIRSLHIRLGTPLLPWRIRLHWIRSAGWCLRSSCLHRWLVHLRCRSLGLSLGTVRLLGKSLASSLD